MVRHKAGAAFVRDDAEHLLLATPMESISLPTIDSLVVWFQSQAPTERNQAVHLLRSRCMPIRGTRLYVICEGIYQRIHSAREEILETLLACLQLPVITGYILSKILASPYTREEVQEIFVQSAEKEFNVMESVPRPPSLNWDGLLGDIYTPLGGEIPFNPLAAERVHRSIDEFIRKATRFMFYPQYSNKTVSRHSRADFFEFQGVPDDGRSLTTLNFEQLYAEEGYRVQGPCEMKQRWYPTNTKPRTYFAMGGTVYHQSKYHGRLFGMLCDEFRPTNRYLRVRPDLISIDEQEEVFIYDLTAFTSLMAEQRWFISALANRCRGVPVVLFDSHIGEVVVDLGQFLYEYRDTCLNPAYRPSEKIWPGVCIDLFHSVAGFLGVYGNLMACTFPHGIVNGMLADRNDANWVAGDDAGVATTYSEKIVDTAVESIGMLAREKVFLLSELGAIALKRGVMRFGNSLVMRRSSFWPSFCYLLTDFDWNLRFDRFVTRRKRIQSFARALLSFMESLVSMHISHSEKEFINAVLGPIYEDWSVPFAGELMGRNGTFPSLLMEDVGEDPLPILLQRYPMVTFRLPVTKEDVDEEECEFGLGSSFVCCMSGRLRWYSDMGYVDREQVEKEILVGDHADVVLKVLKYGSGLPGKLYRFTVVEDIPIYAL